MLLRSIHNTEVVKFACIMRVGEQSLKVCMETRVHMYLIPDDVVTMLCSQCGHQCLSLHRNNVPTHLHRACMSTYTHWTLHIDVLIGCLVAIC